MKSLILDLDHTLLNTSAFKNDLVKSLGLTEIQWDNAYNKFVEDYSVFHPKDLLHGVDSKVKDAFYKVVENTRRYLYPDSLTFINSALNNGWNVTILTYGQVDWQQQKLEAINFPKEVVLHPTDEPKVKALQNYIGDVTVVIDDNALEIDAVKATYPEITGIWMKRPEGKYRNTEPKQCDKLVEELIFNLEDYAKGVK